MAKKDDADGSVRGIPKKWDKLLEQSWKDTSESYSNDELKKKIVEFEQAISTLEKDMEIDTKILGLKDRLAELKEELKEVSSSYVDGMKESQAKIRYMVYLLESRGVA